MLRSRKSGYALVLLASLFWGPGLAVFLRLLGPETPPLALQFHFLFWAAVAMWAALFLTGRTSEMSIFSRQETRLLVLVATGGYGVWLLRSLVISTTSAADIQIFFYTAPLWIAFFSFFTTESAGAKQIGGLLLGFVGCIMMLTAPRGSGASPGSQLPTVAKALGSGVCWALFAVGARPLVKQGRVLPIAALAVGAGAACLLVTCLTMKVNVLSISLRQLWLSAVAGILTVAIPYGLWLKGLSILSPAAAAPWWYLGVVFGAVWTFFMQDGRAGWWSLGGIVLILVSLRFGGPSIQARTKTMGDLIRETGGQTRQG